MLRLNTRIDFHTSMSFIRCAFGQLIRRWGVLWRALEGSLEENIRTISVCIYLHNFCKRKQHGDIPRCFALNEHDNKNIAAPTTHLQNGKDGVLHTENLSGRRTDMFNSSKRTRLATETFASGLRRPDLPGRNYHH